jgi:hypothetical protein
MPRIHHRLHDPTAGFNHPMKSVRGSTLGGSTLGDTFTQPTAGFNRPIRNSRGTLGDSSFLDWITGGHAADLSDPNLQKSSSGDASITAADFAQSGGVCKPKNFIALNYVKELQRQMNRVAQMKGFGKISVDGSIGSGTQGLLKKIQSVTTGVMGTTTSCIGVAADADVIGDQVRVAADGMGAPATVSGPATGSSASQIALANGKIATVPGTGDGIMGAFTSLGDTEKLVMVGLLGGIGYVIYKGKKRGRR